MTDSASPWLPTACILCECNCGIEVQLGGDDGRRMTKFRGDRRHPTSQGYACEKPHRLDYYQHSPDRILHPLRRRDDGSFEEIDWDTAISEISARFARLGEQYGGESIFYYGGGGQGNHLPGAYGVATRRAYGLRYRSSALAQEKTGEFWASQQTFGTYTRADFEHCEVAVFIGKNPWFSHGIPRARTTLREIAKAPDRTLIVIDPRRTKTAALADIHLQVRPGTDAWLMAALLAVIVQEGLEDRAFVDDRTHGFESLRPRFMAIDVAAYCEHSGVDESKVRKAARAIASAKSAATFEDLGVQMNRHSTVVSYLHRILIALTGNYGKPGSHYTPTVMVPVADGVHKYDTPVTGARIIGGLVPCNSIADEILTDHPKRFRGMLIESANPAHSLADAPRMREALAALDTVVVIDIAMTETAALADYVLPARTQFEKAEATFFNFEFPKNYFHLRHRLFEAPDGPLPEAEIHARLVEATGRLEGAPLAELRAAADQGLEAYAQLFVRHVVFNRKLASIAPVILYRTLGPSLPEEVREGAVLFGLALRLANTSGKSLAAAGFEGNPVQAAIALFRAILDHPSGLIMTVDEWSDIAGRIGTADGKIQLVIEEFLEVVDSLTSGPPTAAEDYPFVLSAGERRAFTANTIVRDAKWRKKDAEGALRLSAHDAAALAIQSGDSVRVETARGAVVVRAHISEAMQPGHISLPNGMGLAGDSDSLGGVSTNELTSTDNRDAFVGTPHHKYVPARLTAV